MQDKLQALEDKYLDLEAKISDPDVIANQAEWQKYARAHAKLTDVVAAYREYKILDKAREEAEEIIADGSDRELAAMAQEELKELKPQLAEYEERLKILLLPSDPNDDKNAIVEIRGGAGGEEAALFAGVLFRMYQHYAESRRWSLEIMDASPTELGGFKEIVFQLSGQGVFGRMKFESGVHRVQRVPETETQGRIQAAVRNTDDNICIYRMFLPQQLAGTDSGIVYGTAVDDRVRACKIHVFKHTQRRFLTAVRPDGANLLSVCHRDLTGIQLTLKGCLYAVQRTGLRCKDIGIVALSDAKRLKTIGIPCSDQLSRAHDHKGIRSLDLATGTSHRFLHRAGFQTLPCDMVGNDLRVNGRLENSSCILQIMSEFRRIDQVTVVRESQGSLDIIEHQRLCVFSGRRTGCRIAHMPHADIPVHGF